MTSHSAPATVSVDLRPVRRALLSVTDKTGLVEFAQALAGHGVELVSTGGTAKALRDAGLAVKDISELTGFPEMLDGRVKTLHPKVHGGILHMRGNAEHVAAVESHGIEPIDMVVVNLYAFEKTAQKPGVAFADVIENIDIGGPSMVRSAAKNFEDVAIVTSVADYATLAEELTANNGSLSRATRWRLAKQAFAVTAAYDAGIATALESIEAPTGAAVFAADAVAADGADHRPAGADAAIWGESAPEGCAICGWQRQRSRRGRAVAGQGAELQQHRRSGCLLGAGAASLMLRQKPRWRSSSTRILAGLRRERRCSRLTGGRLRRTRFRRLGA